LDEEGVEETMERQCSKKNNNNNIKTNGQGRRRQQL